MSDYRLAKSVVALLMMLAAACGSLLPGHVFKPPVASHVKLAVFVAGSGAQSGFVESEAYTIFGGPL